MLKAIQTIGVIGAGQMGAGIAQVCATSGLKVWLYDISEEPLKKALNHIEKSLEKLLAKKLLAEEQHAQTIKNLNITTEWKDLKEIDFCIEAAPEKEDLKKQIFAALDRWVKPQTILATNTSSIPIEILAKETHRADKVIGMHFMNPPPLMPCVEVICSEKTSKETHQITLELVKKLGKTPVTVKDAPGFVVNRILMPMINDAINIVHQGLANKEDVDTAMKLSCNFPMGPLTLADFIGLDTCLSILRVMKEKPCALLEKYVEEGKLGRKTGEGFYKY